VAETSFLELENCVYLLLRPIEEIRQDSKDQKTKRRKKEEKK